VANKSFISFLSEFERMKLMLNVYYFTTLMFLIPPFANALPPAEFSDKGKNFFLNEIRGK